MMNDVPKENFDDSWDQFMEIIVLPLSLQQYWDAFWADNAPYFVAAFKRHEDDEITKHTNWS